VIVGATGADPNGRSGAGAAYVIFGKASGFADVDLASFTSGNSTGFVIKGAAAGDQLGNSVSGAGDVNGDGYADVIVGAPSADSYTGAAYVIFAMKDGFADVNTLNYTLNASGSAGYIMWGAAVGDRLGTSVSGAGMY
jgi:hypothetical protein